MKVDQKLLEILDRVDTDGPKLRIREKLDRTTYLSIDKVLKSAGGQWNRSAQAHLFPAPGAAEAIEQILQTGEVTTVQETQFFPTPPAVAAKMMEWARPMAEPTRVLEPSAGDGHLVSWILRYAQRVDVCEIRPDALAKLVDSDPKRIIPVGKGDFLYWGANPVYDRVLMNPPFAKKQDAQHILHAHKFLAEGGRLISVASSGVTFRQDKIYKELRELIKRKEGIIEPLPEHSFKSAGTEVNTVLLSIPA